MTTDPQPAAAPPDDDAPAEAPPSIDDGISAHPSVTPTGTIMRVVVGAVLAMAAAFIPLAQYTCAMLLWPDSSMNIQPIPGDDGPIPTALVWSPRTYRLLTAVGGFPMAGALTLYIVIAAGGAYIIARILNPSFRITTGVDWNRRILIRTYMHTAPLIKVIVTIVPVLVAVFFIWLALSAVIPSGVALSIATALITGGAVWLALSRNGFVGDCESGNYLMPSPGDTISLLVRGATCGGVFWLILFAVNGAEPQGLLRMGRALGGLGETGWRPLAAFWLTLAAVGGVAAVLSAIGFGTPVLGRTARGFYGGFGALIALALTLGVHAGLPAYTASHFDYSWRTGAAIAPRWWHGKSAHGPKNVMVAVPVHGRWRIRAVADRGVSDIELSAPLLDRVRQHLAGKRYQTALSVTGFTALYDYACRELDGPGRIAASREALARCGDPAFTRTFLMELWTQAGTEHALNAIPTLGDARVLRYLTDNARLPAGDLCVRNGMTQEAIRWYRDAGLPASGANARSVRLKPFTDTAVTGVLRGVPKGVTARVGLIPAQAELTMAVSQTGNAAVAPFTLREVARSCAPDAGGAFRMSGFPGGPYRLVIWLAADPRKPMGALGIASGTTGLQPFDVSPGNPRIDVGELRIVERRTPNR